MAHGVLETHSLILPSSLFPLPSVVFPLSSYLLPLTSYLCPLPSSFFPLPFTRPGGMREAIESAAPAGKCVLETLDKNCQTIAFLLPKTSPCLVRTKRRSDHFGQKMTSKIASNFHPILIWIVKGFWLQNDPPNQDQINDLEPILFTTYY